MQLQIFAVIRRRNNRIPLGASSRTGRICANSGLAETKTRIKTIALKKKGQEQKAEMKGIYCLVEPASSLTDPNKILRPLRNGGLKSIFKITELIS